MKDIESRISKIASGLVAADDVFTIKKPIKFLAEGVTRNALANARMIADAGYRFVKGTVYHNDDLGGIQSMDAYFERDGEISYHRFVGFNFGYGGEGPHGMMEFSQVFGIGLKGVKVLNHDYRASLPSKAIMDLVQMLG